MIIQSIIEIIIAAVLIAGLIFEDKVAEAEQKIINKIRRSK